MKAKVYIVSKTVSPQVQHTNFNLTLTFVHFYTSFIPLKITPRLSPSLHYTSLHYASLRFTSLRFTSLHFTSQPFQIIFNTLPFPSVYLIDHIPNPLSKMLGLQGRAPKIFAGNRFQSRMVVFTKEYFLISRGIFCMCLYMQLQDFYRLIVHVDSAFLNYFMA